MPSQQITALPAPTGRSGPQTLFRPNQKVLAQLAIFSCSLLWQPVFPCLVASKTPIQIPNQAGSDLQKLDSATDKRIDRLVKELGSPSFAVRQEAVEQLWEFGIQARPALERAASVGDSEVARRVNELLSVLAMGIDENTSPEIAKLVLHFHASEQNMRAEVLRRLVDDGMFQLVFNLLQQVNNENDQRELFDEVLQFDDTLISLARGDRWDDFEFILGHPITFKHRPSAAVHYQLANGSLVAMVRRLRQTIKSHEEDGISLKTDELFRLIGIFRLLGDYQLAHTYARKIKDVRQRDGLVNQLLMEQGDWHAIAERMVKSENNAGPGVGEIVVTPAQRALVYQFVGNRSGYDETVNELSKKAAEFNRAHDPQGELATRETLVEIGLANLDWPLVESNLNPEDKFESFQLLVTNNRTMKAFEIVGLGTDVEQRDLWFNRRVRNIRSLEAKSKRFDITGQDKDDVNTRLSQTWSNSFQVASLLGSLGLTDESALHFQTLFGALESDDQKYRRFDVIQELVELEQYDLVWKLIETGIDTNHYRQLISYIFPNREPSSWFLYDLLKTRYPDPLERLKVTSGILNSPLGTIPSFDLQVELASAFSNPNSSRNVDYFLGKIYEFHGDEESSRQHLTVARELGLEGARQAHALEAFANGDYESAVEFYGESWQTRKSGFETILASEAHRQTGDQKQAMLLQCLAYAMWRDSYRNTGTLMSLEEIDNLHLIRDILKLETIALDRVSISSERYRGHLAAAQLMINPVQSAINQQLALFNAASEASGNRTSGFWSESRKQIMVAQTRSRIANGKFSEALQPLLQYNAFCPGDPDIGEKFIHEFDRHGATEQADMLFEKLTEPYFEILEQFPDSSLHHNNYAWICACGNRRTEHMLRHGLKACAQRPNSSTFGDTLAEIYFLLGDTEIAIELCRRCIEINPTKRHYRQQLKRFQAGLK